MRSFFGGSDSNDKTPSSNPSTTTSMFSYFSSERRPSQPAPPQPPAPPPSKNVPGFQTPGKPNLGSGPGGGNQPPQSQQQQSQSQQQQQQSQQQAPPNTPVESSITTALKIKLSSPTLAINTPILCHGYGNQEGIFCWYRSSPSNPYQLITTTLQPSYSPCIDDANNTISCQFKPDQGVPSEIAKIGPLRLPPEMAHSVIRLMQNKNFINYPVTYINTKGCGGVDLMQKWIKLMTKIQELEVKKAAQIASTEESLAAQWSAQSSNVKSDKGGNGKEKDDKAETKRDLSGGEGKGPEKGDDEPDQTTTPKKALSIVPPNLSSAELTLESEQIALNKLKYDPQIDVELALVHQELQSLIISDSFNPIVRICPAQNVMESHNIRHLQDYTLTINSETLELVFTPPEDPFGADIDGKRGKKKSTTTTTTPTTSTTTTSTSKPQSMTVKPGSRTQIGVDDSSSEDEDGVFSEDEDADSEDEDHSLITHHKNKSSMGDLLSFLSTGVGNADPKATPIAAGKLSSIASDDDEDEGEGGQLITQSTATTNLQTAEDIQDELNTKKKQQQEAEEKAKKKEEEKLEKAKALEEKKKERAAAKSTSTGGVADGKKKLSQYQQSMLWNSTKMPNIPLSCALIFTPRHDVSIPLDKNIKLDRVDNNKDNNKTQTTTPAPTITTTATTTPNSGNTIKAPQSGTITTKPPVDDSGSQYDDEITYLTSQLLLICDIRTSFVYIFHFDSALIRDQYGLALRAMSEKLHHKRSILTNNVTAAANAIAPNPIPGQNPNTSAAMTSIIPPAPVFKSWLPLELQQQYKITAPSSLTLPSSPSLPAATSTTLAPPSSPRILADITTGGVSTLANYFNDLEPVELFQTISQTTWFNQLYPHYIPPPTQQSSNSPQQQQQLSPQQQQQSPNGGLSPTPTPPSAHANPDNILPDVALLFRVYQHDQDTLISSLQEKIQYLYQRNLYHKKQSQLLTRQQHMVSLELEIYKEKYHNERAYNDELVQSYYDGAINSVGETEIGSGHPHPILSRQLFRNQQHAAMVKTNSLLSDTRGFDLTAHHPATATPNIGGKDNTMKSGGNNSGLMPVTPQKSLKPSTQQRSGTQLYDSKMSSLTKEMLQASQSTPALNRADLGSEVGELQDKIMSQQQAIQQLKRDNKQLIATNMTYKEQASLADEFEQEILKQKDVIKQLQSKIRTGGGGGASDLPSSPSIVNSSSPAITTLQTTIVELTQQTQTQQQDIALKERKIANYESQIQKLTAQLHLAYQQQQDLITKGIKVEQDKLHNQINSTERELNDATNVIDLMRNENNLFKTQHSLMESLNIQQHVEIETLETTIETLQTSIVGLINENEYLKKQQQAFITLQQQFKQQQAQLLLLQHENVTLSNTIQEHQQHIVNLQQQKQTMGRNQSILGQGGQGGSGGGLGSSVDSEKLANLQSELQYYKQKCFSLSTSMERLMRKHHQEMVQSNNNNPNQNGQKGGAAKTTAAPVSGANTALIDPLNDTSDQELLYKIYTQQAHTMSHEQLCKEYKIMIKQLELLIETNKLLRFDIKQVRLQHDALQQQYNERIKYAPQANQTGGHGNVVTIQTLQRDLLEKQLSETKHLVTTLTFVLQDKQQHIDLIKNTNKHLVIELEEFKKKINDMHLQQQEQQHLAALQQVANGQMANTAPSPTTFSSPNNGQPFYF